MPRYVKPYRTRSDEQRAKRRDTQVVRGYKKWIDPFPHIHGTLPEKMVYAALSRRGINFYFLNNVQIAIPEIEMFKKYQADFVIPNHKIIIEVQGAFWHSKDAAIESDAFKFALYQMMGYRVFAWWDFDILKNVNELFLQIPELNAYMADNSEARELAPYDRTKVDTSKGIVTLNQRRGQRLAYRKKPVTLRSKRHKTYKGYKLNAQR